MKNYTVCEVDQKEHRALLNTTDKTKQNKHRNIVQREPGVFFLVYPFYSWRQFAEHFCHFFFIYYLSWAIRTKLMVLVSRGWTADDWSRECSFSPGLNIDATTEMHAETMQKKKTSKALQKVLILHSIQGYKRITSWSNTTVYMSVKRCEIRWNEGLLGNPS